MYEERGSSCVAVPLTPELGASGAPGFKSKQYRVLDCLSGLLGPSISSLSGIVVTLDPLPQ